MLGSARHEIAERHAEWADGHDGDARSCSSRCSDADAGRIVEELLGSASSGASATRIAAAAEGNPLYVEQIVSMLVETGAIERGGDGWVATRARRDLQIPPTVQALVAARLDALERRGARGRRPGVGHRPRLRRRRGLRARRGRHAGRSPVQTSTSSIRSSSSARLPEEEVVPVRAPDHPRHRLRQPAQARPAPTLHERFVDWAERDQPRARPRARVRGDPRLPPRAGVSLPGRARLGRRARARSASGPRSKLSSAGQRALARGDMPGRGQPAPPVDRAAAGDVGLPARAHGRPRRRQSPARWTSTRPRTSSTRRWRSPTRPARSAMRSGRPSSRPRSTSSGSGARVVRAARWRSRRARSPRSNGSMTRPASPAPGAS